MSKADFREQILKELLAKFDSRLDESIDSFTDEIRQEDIDVVKAKYTNAFHNFLATAFDLAFQKELTSDSNDSKANAADEESEAEFVHNLSVTDDDLQRLDDVVTQNACRRKLYPAKCALLLEKALKLQVESSAKIRTNVHVVDKIKDGEDEEADEFGGKADTDDNKDSVIQLSKEIEALRKNLIEANEKARSVEETAKVMLDNQNFKN